MLEYSTNDYRDIRKILTCPQLRLNFWPIAVTCERYKKRRGAISSCDRKGISNLIRNPELRTEKRLRDVYILGFFDGILSHQCGVSFLRSKMKLIGSDISKLTFEITCDHVNDIFVRKSSNYM